MQVSLPLRILFLPLSSHTTGQCREEPSRYAPESAGKILSAAITVFLLAMVSVFAGKIEEDSRAVLFSDY
jgi:hypothetical protein